VLWCVALPYSRGAGRWRQAEAIGAELATKERDVLHLLASLVDKSLVIAEKNQETGDMRYSFLETVRQYGQEHLLETGEASGARRRHLEWYLSFAAQADTNLWSEDGPVWIKRLETELDNLRSALEYSRELEDECEAGMFMAGSLAQFWYMRGYWSEGGTGWKRCGGAVIPARLRGAPRCFLALGYSPGIRTITEQPGPAWSRAEIFTASGMTMKDMR
jgi:predicted ATPase